MNINPTQLERRNNNFDLLRLIAALLVLITHSFILRGAISKEPLVILSSNKLNFSVIGLTIFFTISGFLVCKSVVETRYAKDYLIKRFLRIWPALFVNVIFTVFFVGLIFTSLSSSEYLTHPQTLRYLLTNISLFKTTQWLPGVFNGEQVNTPLWTIPIEVKLYLLLLICSKVGLLRKKIVVLVVWICCVLLLGVYASGALPALNKMMHPELSNLSLGTYFLGGTLCYLFKDFIQFRLTIWISLLVIWLLVFKYPPLNKAITIPFFIYSFLYFACNIRHIPFLNMDLSYGIYLYALPIQRSIQTFVGEQLNFPQFLILSIAITILCASASWFFIEKKALSLKNFLRKDEK